MVSIIRDPHLGPGPSRTHAKLTSGRGTTSAPHASSPCVSVAQRAQDSHMGPDIGAESHYPTAQPRRANNTQAFARTSRNSSRYRSCDLALREPALRYAALSRPCPTQTYYGDTAAVKSRYLSAQRYYRDATQAFTWCKHNGSLYI